MPLPQTMSKAFRQALVDVGHILEVTTNDWCLIGGAAAILHGIDQPEANDIDILLSVPDAEHVLAKLELTATPDGGTERFRSEVFCCWRGLAVQVDFIAGFEVHGPVGWVAIPPQPALQIVLEDTKLFIPSVASLIDMHALFARPKDVERIQLLEQCVD